MPDAFAWAAAMDSLFHHRAEDRPVSAAVAALVAGIALRAGAMAHADRAVAACRRVPPCR